MRTHPRFLVHGLVVLALALTACGGGSDSTEVIEQNLDAQEAALEALRGRVSDLASEVGSTSSAPPDTQIDDITAQLDDLVTRLEDVESSVAEQGDEDVTATVAAEIGKFSEEIEGLVASVRDLTTVVNQVRTDVDRLEAAFEEHADDPFAHGRGGTDDE